MSTSQKFSVNKGFAGIYILIGIVVLAVLGGAFLKLANSDFENCKKAPDSIILEMYPLVCRDADGKNFTEKNWRMFLLPFIRKSESIPQSQIPAPPTPLSTATMSTLPLSKLTSKITDTAVTSTPAPTLKIANKTIHLYPYYGADASVSINKLNIIGVLFIPKDITTQIKPEWLANMEKVFARIKGFYEKQFDNNIQITYQIIKEPIKGNLNIEEYYPWDLTKEIEDKNQNLLQNGAHNVWMIYLVRDPDFQLNLKGGSLGGLANLNAATQYEYWLNDDAVNTGSYGIINSAHEFGHALGIPHPWDLPANINHEQNFGNVLGDIMGYYPEKDLDKNFIRDDVKEVMGL